MKNWEKELKPLFDLYGKRKHPLDYNNEYQLLVMIILSAQTTDSMVNRIAPSFFGRFPSFSVVKDHMPEDLYDSIKSIRGYMKKAQWIVDIARSIGSDANIPRTVHELTKLPGIGRKSANVFIREVGGNAEGVMVDLHVARVAPRLGISGDPRPERIEKDIMDALPQDRWNEAGMAFSYHGRETCRPKPECGRCIVNYACEYYKSVKEKSLSG